MNGGRCTAADALARHVSTDDTPSPDFTRSCADARALAGQISIADQAVALALTCAVDGDLAAASLYLRVAHTLLGVNHPLGVEPRALVGDPDAAEAAWSVYLRRARPDTDLYSSWLGYTHFVFRREHLPGALIGAPTAPP
jgi:hypothetical protein